MRGRNRIGRLTKSQQMASVRTRDTNAERVVRCYLFAAGFRFRKNDKRLPGSPDIVLPRYRTAVFVHGCFWHGHEGCPAAKLPRTRTEFWGNKQAQNRARDYRDTTSLAMRGWRVLYVWGCEISTRSARESRLERLVGEISSTWNYEDQ